MAEKFEKNQVLPRGSSEHFNKFTQRHRRQMQKIFNHKSFNYLVWTPLGSIVNLKKHFCLEVHFKVSAA
jgi:hypothetical protein